jgi:Holliday junction resolvase RusA-like endonuclease
MSDPLTGFPRPGVSIVVYGTPAPQGSKKAFAWTDKGTGRARASMVESSKDRVRAWRSYVVDRAREVMAGRPPFTGPCEVSMVFTFTRPRSHYGTGRNAAVLRPGAPARPASGTTGDLSKLCRATEDALTDAGIWADDKFAVEYTRLAKVYSGEDADALELPGAIITVRLL